MAESTSHNAQTINCGDLTSAADPSYVVRAACTNCHLVTHVRFPRGEKTHTVVCPTCGCTTLVPRL